MISGAAVTNDFNGEEQSGFGLYQVTQRKGLRHSVAGAFLHPELARDNLAIQAEAQATKLIIENNRCVGVQFRAGGVTHEARANQEIILTAGAIGSPHLLMLSGIGDREALGTLGIEAVQHLPGVGQNLQDHFMVPVAYACTQPVTLAHANTPEQSELLGQGKGLLTSNIGEAGDYMTIMYDAPVPDLQFHFAPNWFIADGRDNPEGDGFTLLPGCLNTRSRGEVKLRSAAPNDAPIIDPNCFSDEKDLDVLVEGVKIARTILNSAPFDAFRGDEKFPGPQIQSDTDIRSYVRDNV